MSGLAAPRMQDRGPVVATIAAKNYLARVRVLHASLRERHPYTPFLLLLTDEPDGCFDPAGEPYPVLTLEDLARPELAEMSRRYSRKELAAAAKPFLLEHLLDSGAGRALFLDPDMLVMADLSAVYTEIGRHPIILTPHLTGPLTDVDGAERELTILRSGTLNAGFVAVADRPEGRAFLQWWRCRTRRHCRLDLAAGIHFDQRWLDLAPVFFPGVHILRDPGVNVGYWNARERGLQVRPEGAVVNGGPVRLFHFSGFDAAQRDRVTAHNPSRLTAEFGEGGALFRDYASRLVAAGDRLASRWPYAWETAAPAEARGRGEGDAEAPVALPTWTPPGGRAVPGRLAAATIAANQHVSLARVLAASFRERHPEVPFFLLLADEADGLVECEGEPFRIVSLEALGLPDLEALRFRYAQPELTYALTPFLLRWLLDQGFDRAAFFKQESLVLGDLLPVLEMLARHSILLTPHLLSPVHGAEREATILQSGVYNVGFLGVSEGPPARRFLDWWGERLRRHCRHDVPRGLHFEQRWLDLAPLFFEGVGIVRDPGFNVGHWNLPERSVRVNGDLVTVDGTPGRFLRLSGFDPERPEAVTRYSPRLTLDNVGDAAELWRRYAALLEAAGHRETRDRPYAYDRFDNGAAVTLEARAFFDEVGGSAGDPLRTAPRGSLYRRLLARRRRQAAARAWQSLRDRFPIRTTVRRLFRRPPL